MYEIGSSLREARVRQGIDYPTAETGTRIRSRYLRAMEDEEFDLLPDPSYARGFLRAYASYLGLDPALALDEFESRYGELAHSLSPEGARRAREQTERGPRRREAQLLWLAIGGVAGVAMLTWLGIGGSSVSTPPAAPTATASEAVTTGAARSRQVDLTFTGVSGRGSYLEVRTGSATGPTLYSGVLVPGATRTFTIPETAWVRIGSPALLRVALDGSPLVINGGTGEFLFSRDGAGRQPGADPLRARIVVTGTEVLEGRVRDENGAAIAADLTARGVRVVGTVVVDDAIASITGAVRDALAADVQLVVVTGGLGPTHDDRTMEAVAAACSVPLQEDPGALALIQDAMSGVGVRASDATRDVAARKQALIPAGAISLPPPGTAPGAVLEDPGGVVVVLPGPPWECMASWHYAVETGPVKALLGSEGGAAPITLRLAGVVESEFIEALDDPQWHDDSLEVGVCAKPGELEVVIRPDSTNARALEAHLDDRFPGAIFSRDGSVVEEVLGRALSARVETLVTAESCTGGIIGARITSVSGASAWYSGGVVSYDNAVKQRALGVPMEVLTAHGAVSAECAAAMAEGVRGRLGATWGLSVTGIAGPGGGTPQKPVGLVYVGIAGPAGTVTRELHLHGDRERVRQRAATLALHLLREAVTG